MNYNGADGLEFGGSSTKVDPSVLKCLPEGCKILSTENHGDSFWASIGRIDVLLSDGTQQSFFIKVVSEDLGKNMVMGEFESMKAVRNVVPEFVPEPIAWGTYVSIPDTHFFLCEFREMTDDMPGTHEFAALLLTLHQKSVSPTGKFGFHVTTYAGNLPQAVEWEDSWETFFAKSMRQALDLEIERKGPSDELDVLTVALFDTVIPRLLRPLESEGRSVKPSLIHGDLWYANAGTDVATGQLLVFDSCCFFAHNEYEFGQWRPPCNRFGTEYIAAYNSFDPISAPKEDFEGRLDLYRLRFDTHVSALFHDRRSGLPGTFDEPGAVFEDDFAGKPSFLGVSSADSAPNDVRLSLDDEYTADMGQEYDMSDDEEIARSSTGQHLAAEHNDASSENGQEEAKATPGGILRARMRAVKDSVGPVTLEVADGDDWAEMLRKTVSPVKRDRQLLREMNESPSKQTGLLIDFDKNDGGSLRRSIWKKSTAKNDMFDGFATNTQFGMDKGRGFATSIDLMNSLFEKPKPAPQNLRASIPGKGFPKWPYERQDKTLTMDEDLKTFHDSGRPTWGPRETLVLTRPLVSGNGRRFASQSDILTFQRSNIQSEKQELRMATFATDSSKKFLGGQDNLTEIRLTDGVPGASFKAASLKDTFHHQDMNDPASIQEKHVWDLASILFDEVNAQNSKPTHLLRKAKLSQFWTDLVEHASSTTISLAGSSEEKAVACLAGHRVPEACKHLLDGRNFRLGTLVPLIGTSDEAKKDMREQLKAWHDSKMLSEFSEPIRTIYELLSGNSCVCEGMKGVPVEDRLDSFVISKKFGLDWKQSFGLRLWYGIAQGDDLAAAVKKFKDDIDQEREYQPLPWYIDQGIKPLWDDVDSDRRQDLLWGLLQLYARDDSDLEAILRPENSQLSPLDMRLSWQLGLALVSTGRVSWGQNGTEKADAAAIAYASQLTSAGEWLEAVFVLLHLSNPVARTKAIQEHLCRHAGLIGTENSPAFAILVNKFCIPLSWIWEALALYMRSVKKDAYSEVQCLLLASSFVEAHRVLVQEVAPLAIVERDYANLSALISQFDGRHEAISEWSLGGEIYSLFLTLLQSRSKGETASPAVLERLLAGLHAMNENAPDSEILRYAAVSDMADETAKEILKATKKKQDVELRSRILNLPLTQDRLLAYSVDLSMDRYREVMSH